MEKEKLIEFLKAQIDGGNFSTPMQLTSLEGVVEYLKTRELITNNQGWGQETKITPVSVKDLLAKDLPPVQWLVEGLIPENCLTIISGNPENYKSWLMLDMSIKICNGQKFLDHFETQKKKVLYIDEEDGEGTMQNRIKKLTSETDFGLEILSLKNFKLLKDTDELLEYCIKNKIGLVIMDSLVRISSGDENSSKDMNKNFESFKKFKNNNITVIISHHHRKSGVHQGSPGEEMRGSGDILASVDCHLTVKKNELENTVTISQHKLRVAHHKNHFKVLIPNENEEFKFTHGGEVKTDKKPEKAKQEILALLSNEDLNQKEIISKLKNNANESISEYSTKKALDELLQDKTVTLKQGLGNEKIYSLSEK